MKKAINLSVLSGALMASILWGGLFAPLHADSDEVKCPIVVDRETGKYSNKKAKYKCYKSKSKAIKSGYKKHNFDDYSGTCTPTPSPTPGQDEVPDGDFNLNGPGERETTVFQMASGGSVTYLFPGGGEFEIKVFKAATEKKLQEVLETTQASSGTLALSPQSSPVYIKVEGPGAWEVAITLN